MFIVFMLIFLNTKSFPKTAIVLLAVPFSAPMIGGLFTSFLMELLVYPAIYLLWRRRDLPHPERDADEQPTHHWWQRPAPVSGVLVPIPSREQKGRP